MAWLNEMLSFMPLVRESRTSLMTKSWIQCLNFVISTITNSVYLVQKPPSCHSHCRWEAWRNIWDNFEQYGEKMHVNIPRDTKLRLVMQRGGGSAENEINVHYLQDLLLRKWKIWIWDLLHLLYCLSKKMEVIWWMNSKIVP